MASRSCCGWTSTTTRAARADAGDFADVDVAIDFSIPATVADNAIRLAELGVATVVIGATGW